MKIHAVNFQSVLTLTAHISQSFKLYYKIYSLDLIPSQNLHPFYLRSAAPLAWIIARDSRPLLLLCALLTGQPEWPFENGNLVIFLSF